MKTIYKYVLQIEDEQYINTYEGHKILLIAEQAGTLCLWAEVDTEHLPEALKILIIGTGHVINPALTIDHLGSAVVGAFVWHVYLAVVDKGGPS